MAKPFIFGYHRRQFRLFRTHVTIENLGDAMLERSSGERLARDFRRALGAGGRSVLRYTSSTATTRSAERPATVPLVVRVYEVKG
jgi:hypothetical protein